MLSVGSVFSGIEGFGLGFERAGMRVLWHCENDPYCQRVIAKHWPDNPIYPDVCALRGCDVEPVDVLCGGFPCPDLSVAGRGAGLDGARSGLWSELARLTGELRPDYLVVENVAALLGRGLGRVLGDLAEIGYDAEWDCLPASAFGAPHRRDRIWIVAYPGGEQHEGASIADERPAATRLSQADPDTATMQRPALVGSQPDGAITGRDQVADTDKLGRDGRARQQWPSRRRELAYSDWWAVEPDVGRVAHGVPSRVDRLRGLGNALVPQIAQWIGERIVSFETVRERETA